MINQQINAIVQVLSNTSNKVIALQHNTENISQGDLQLVLNDIGEVSYLLGVLSMEFTHLDKQKEQTLEVSLFNSLVEEIKVLHEQKDREYGSSFTEACKELGTVTGFVQIYHKYKRLETLRDYNDDVEEINVMFESIRDNLIDAAVYMLKQVTILDREHEGEL